MIEPLATVMESRMATTVCMYAVWAAVMVGVVAFWIGYTWGNRERRRGRVGGTWPRMTGVK